MKKNYALTENKKRLKKSNYDYKKKTARTSQKEEEVGELPRATEVTGGRRSFQF